MSDSPPFPEGRSQSPDADATSGADAVPDEEGDPSFEAGGPFGDSFEKEFEGGAARTGDSMGTPAAGQLRFGWQVARMWMKDHQEASMLGAFAVGVLVGSYLRD